ncbi:MAG: 30S ribosomal protein S21 [Candidatus Liptonbacteria bacterium]
MIEIKKKEGEPPLSAHFRFTKKVRQGGILAETRRRRFKSRNVNRLKRRLSAVYRSGKKKEVERLKKLGAL